MNKKIGIGILIVVLVIAAGVYAYVEKNASPDEWIRSYDHMYDLSFEYPANWEVRRWGTNKSDEATSVVRVEKGDEWIEFITSTEAAIIPSCPNVTAIFSTYSETIQRIFASAKCSGQVPVYESPEQMPDLIVEAVVGKPLTITVTPLFTGMGRKSVDFGDGTKEGPSCTAKPDTDGCEGYYMDPMTHTYANPGTYTITYTSAISEPWETVSTTTVTVSEF